MMHTHFNDFNEVGLRSTRYSVFEMLKRLKTDQSVFGINLDDEECLLSPFLKSKIIEIVLCDLPISNILVQETRTGRFNIVSGSQVLKCIRDFSNGLFELCDLELLNGFNGLTLIGIEEKQPRQLARFERYELNFTVIRPSIDATLVEEIEYSLKRYSS
jgi:hypothetical protein